MKIRCTHKRHYYTFAFATIVYKLLTFFHVVNKILSGTIIVYFDFRQMSMKLHVIRHRAINYLLIKYLYLFNYDVFLNIIIISMV